ncbi:MAG TPA: hypothetical protein PLZ93_25800 [Nocardioides sp.]|uniref:hypothetical protein n=1 Tax=uncultured Nocardioides sp. TaxID=198441 RepID=UPI002604A7C1|nr:hypothetical protein [uncultured Nocardioides sp.]HRI99065.1 hypothetical protein [Nocardioides sp.]
MTPPNDEPVGSVGDEAAKLFSALADWAGDHLGDGLGGVGDGLGGLADKAREVDEHLATGSAECLYCPVCRTVHAVRHASPEVKAQLATAASSFLQAAASLLAAAGGTGSQPAPRVQHIDLDPDDPDDPDQDQL